MTPEIISHIVWAVVWVALALFGWWGSVAIGTVASGMKLISAAAGDFDTFGKKSARSMIWVVIGWLVGVIWFGFGIIKAIIHVVTIFV